MNAEPISPNTSRRRSIIPLLVILTAGGLFLWGQARDSELTRVVAETARQAALSVCDATPMPESLHWTVSEFKSTFVEAIRPACGGGDPTLPIDATAVPGDRADRDGKATHLVTVNHGAVPLLQMRVHALEPDLITVIGWSKP